MERVISATEARIYFGALIQELTERQEPVIVKRGGKPQIVILSIAEYERLKAEKQENWREALAQAARRGDQPLPSSEEIIRHMREERDEQLLSYLH